MREETEWDCQGPDGSARLEVISTQIQGEGDSPGPAGLGGDQACGEAALQPSPDSRLLLSAYHSPTVLGVPFLEQALAGGMSESEDFRKDPGAHTLEQVCSGARRIPWAGQS